MKKIIAAIAVLAACFYNWPARATGVGNPAMQVPGNIVLSFPIHFGAFNGTNYVDFSTNYFKFTDNQTNVLLFTNGTLSVNGAPVGGPGATLQLMTNAAQTVFATIGGLTNNDTRTITILGNMLLSSVGVSGSFVANGALVQLNPLTVTANGVSTVIASNNITASTVSAANFSGAGSNGMMTAAYQSNTNLSGQQQSANWFNSYRYLVASGFGAPADVNSIFFPVATNVLANGTGRIIFWDGAGNWRMVDNVNSTVRLFSIGGYSSIAGTGWTVGAGGTAPGGTTYWTNAPLTAAVIAQINAAVGSTVVTVGSPSYLSSGLFTNSTYGGYAINQPPTVSSWGGLDTFGPNVRNWVPNGHGFLYYENGGNNSVISFMDANGHAQNNIQDYNQLDVHSGQLTHYMKWNAWGDPAKDLINSRGYTGMPTTGLMPYPTGSGSTLEDIPFDRANIIAAMPIPSIGFYTGVSPGINTNEVAFTNMAAQLATAGILTAISNVAPNVCYLHGDGNCFFNSLRDFVQTPYVGQLTINMVNFPDGTNTAKILHNYGLLMGGTIYAYAFPTNQVNVDFFGNVCSATYPYNQPAMAPNNVSADISKLYDFGWDKVRVADDQTTEGYYSLFTKKLVDNILQPQVLNFGFQKQSYTTVTSQAGKNRLAPIATEFLYNYPGNIPPFAWGAINCIENDQYGGWPGAAIAAGTNAIAYMDIFRYDVLIAGKKIGPGCYPPPIIYINNADHTVLDSQFAMTLAAISTAPPEIAWDYNTPIGTLMPNVCTALTNSTFLRIYLDPLVNQPYKVFDQGPTNISCWARQLKRGEFGVMVANETAFSSNIVVSLSALGASPTASYAVISAWDNNAYLGTFSGLDSFTYTTVADGCGLFKLVPVTTTTQTLSSNPGNLTTTYSATLNAVFPNNWWDAFPMINTRLDNYFLMDNSQLLAAQLSQFHTNLLFSAQQGVNGTSGGSTISETATISIYTNSNPTLAYNAWTYSTNIIAYIGTSNIIDVPFLVTPPYSVLTNKPRIFLTLTDTGTSNYWDYGVTLKY